MSPIYPNFPSHYQSDFIVPEPIGSLNIPGQPMRHTHSDRNTRLSLVIPTYCESENIQQMITQLSQTLDQVLRGEYELIIVDDDSPDLTWKTAHDLCLDYPQLRVMRRQQERGLSTAVIRGWQVADGDILGVIDADLQHPPETLLNLLAEINKGADLAVGSRHVDNGGVSDWSLRRRFLSRGAQVLGLMILPGVMSRVSDPMSGYFLVRREAIAEKVLSPIGYKILIEVLAQGTIRWIAEVGYVFQERAEGASKVTWKQYIEYLQHLIRLRLTRWPIQRFLRFGVVGFSGVFVDITTFYLLRNLGLGLTLSVILSGEIAIVNNFLWNDRWTFADLTHQQRSWTQGLKRFLKFNLICLTGLVLNAIIVNILSRGLGINEYLAKLIAIALVTFWNFWVNLKLSWRVTDVER
ncbi:glycosyltransferase family 2 protein [Limnoraphis robusta]|uniref:glycosyltransferase family 2 protein n=1 Tax=Limnoraphis robusta TaxID=1118279 RepID=UPI002B1FFB56|nr:glycosyltransferase family 2 protein [Limnoraphis robusta]MEA5497768.1 glycosyltransferase family 2 protein [Limnoraphis robusta BA-68 BA1]